MLLEIFLDTYLKLTVKLPKEPKTVHASMLSVLGNFCETSETENQTNAENDAC